MHRTLWSYYYPETPNYHEYTTNSSLNSTSSAYFVSNIIFSHINGNCIHLADDNTNNKLLVSDVTFCHLTGNEPGLAIYQNSGECIQTRNYNLNSSNLNNGAHSNIFFSNSDNVSKNYLFLTSMAECQSKRHVFRQSYGNNLIKYNNISKNIVERDAITFSSLHEFSFSIITNNTIKNGTICYLANGNSFLKCCSFISNIDKHTTAANGLFYFENGYHILLKLILEKNNVDKFIMHIHASSIEFVDCYLNGNTYNYLSFGTHILLNQTESKFVSLFCRAKLEKTEFNEDNFISNYHIFDTIFAIFICTHIDFD